MHPEGMPERWGPTRLGNASGTPFRVLGQTSLSRGVATLNPWLPSLMPPASGAQTAGVGPLTRGAVKGRESGTLAVDDHCQWASIWSQWPFLVPFQGTGREGVVPGSSPLGCIRKALQATLRLALRPFSEPSQVFCLSSSGLLSPHSGGATYAPADGGGVAPMS